MRIDAHSWYLHKRICISIDDDLFDAFAKFSKKTPEKLRDLLRKKITAGEFKNSSDARFYIYSQLMKPSAFACFTKPLSDQVDLEDIC